MRHAFLQEPHSLLIKTLVLSSAPPPCNYSTSVPPLKKETKKEMAATSSPISQLSVEQLKAVKEQSDLEVNLLQDSLNKIRTASIRLDNASSALNDLSRHPLGQIMLVPLTASLYVPGTLDDADNVLVDVGTGYFIEVNPAFFFPFFFFFFDNQELTSIACLLYIN